MKFSDDFFKREIRCDFEIEEMMKRAWAAQLEVLQVIDEVCRKNDLQYFHGFPYQRIGIDIFSLDAVPQNKEQEELQNKIIAHGVVLLRDWEELQRQNKLEDALQQYERLCNVKIPRQGMIKNWIWRMIDAVCSLYPMEGSTEIAIYQYGLGNENYHCKKEWYEEAVYLPFENIQMPVPCAYDEVLTAEFGDYKIPVRGAAGHDYPFYGHMESELKRQIAAVGFTGSVEEFCDKVSKGELYV